MAARLLERIRDDDEFDLISDEIELALAHYDSQLSAMILVTILAKTIGSIADEADRSMMINYASDMILAVAGMEINQPKEGPHEKISNRSGAARRLCNPCLSRCILRHARYDQPQMHNDEIPQHEALQDDGKVPHTG